MAAGCNAAGGACKVDAGLAGAALTGGGVTGSSSFGGTSFNNNCGTRPAATLASANAKWRHLAARCKSAIGRGPNTYPIFPSSLCNPPNLRGWPCLASVAMSVPSTPAKMLAMMRCSASSFARTTMSGCCAIGSTAVERTAADSPARGLALLLAHQDLRCQCSKSWYAVCHND